MADRRCFTKKITESDAFLEMPLSTQCLYFHLNMSADDDGFVNSPKKIQRMIGASDDDLKVLIAKAFILVFESGVIVIKHWRMNNTLRNDRYHPTDYQEEYRMLGLKENKSYTWQPNGNQLEPQHNITKHNITKNNRKEYKEKKIPPSIEEIEQYCSERNNGINANAFYDFYESKDWYVGKNKMKDWKACIRTWEQREPKNKKIVPSWFNQEINTESQMEDEDFKEFIEDFRNEENN